MKIVKTVAVALMMLTGTAVVANPIAVRPDTHNTTKIHISYYANGGSGSMPEQKVTIGRSAKLKANKFKRPNYVFAGWKTSPWDSYVSYSDGEKVWPSGDLSLYASWIYDEWEWMNRATVHAGTVYDNNENEYAGTAVVKVGKRSRAGVCKVSVKVTFTADFRERMKGEMLQNGRRGNFPRTVTFTGKTSGGAADYVTKDTFGSIEFSSNSFWSHVDFNRNGAFPCLTISGSLNK